MGDLSRNDANSLKKNIDKLKDQIKSDTKSHGGKIKNNNKILSEIKKISKKFSKIN